MLSTSQIVIHSRKLAILSHPWPWNVSFFGAQAVGETRSIASSTKLIWTDVV